MMKLALTFVLSIAGIVISLLITNHADACLLSWDSAGAYVWSQSLAAPIKNKDHSGVCYYLGKIDAPLFRVSCSTDNEPGVGCDDTCGGKFKEELAQLADDAYKNFELASAFCGNVRTLPPNQERMKKGNWKRLKEVYATMQSQITKIYELSKETKN